MIRDARDRDLEKARAAATECYDAWAREMKTDQTVPQEMIEPVCRGWEEYVMSPITAPDLLLNYREGGLSRIRCSFFSFVQGVMAAQRQGILNQPIVPDDWEKESFDLLCEACKAMVIGKSTTQGAK